MTIEIGMADCESRISKAPSRYVAAKICMIPTSIQPTITAFNNTVSQFRAQS